MVLHQLVDHQWQPHGCNQSKENLYNVSFKVMLEEILGVNQCHTESFTREH